MILVSSTTCPSAPSGSARQPPRACIWPPTRHKARPARALDPLQRDHAVGGGLVVANAQVGADEVPDLVAAHDGAEGVGADADGVRAVGVAFVLRVEGRHTTHLGSG